jgi:predicted O-methyltransferase YrrM
MDSSTPDNPKTVIPYPNEHFVEAANVAERGEGASNPALSHLLYSLAKNTGGTNFCEIGTFRGTTTIWLALAAKEAGGKLTAIDTNHNCITSTHDRLDGAGLRNHVDLIRGEGHKAITKYDYNHFDLVFLDANHKWEELYKLWSAVYTRVKHGGLICFHDVYYYLECGEGSWLGMHFPHALRIRGLPAPDPYVEGKTVEHGLAIVQKGI